MPSYGQPKPSIAALLPIHDSNEGKTTALKLNGYILYNTEDSPTFKYPFSMKDGKGKLRLTTLSTIDNHISDARLAPHVTEQRYVKNEFTSVTY